MGKIKIKQITEVSILDPDSNEMVDITIYKMETGGMIGIDSSFLSNTDEPIFSPFDNGIELDIKE